jgi:phosphoadenosine phosphosulfate reductase
MYVTMVKKRLLSGEPCQKCLQAEELLRRRGLWERIDEVVWADESDPSSPGMKLAEQKGIELAPFFVVREDDGREVVYTSALRFINERLGAAPRPAASEPAPELAELRARFSDSDPEALVRWALERYGKDLGLSFSGAEDVVLIDMAVRAKRPFSVFTLDTGRLHPETYRFIDKVRAHYGVEIAVMAPAAELLEPFVRKKGLFSFYQDGHGECCGVRKVEPLGRALSNYRAWMTGQRRDQSPTRSELTTIEIDAARQGRDGPLLKLNPLAGWSLAQVWEYIIENGVPYNPLHDQGFVSIGCEPCTRPVRPGEHERAGRWWWEEATQRECGLHVPGRSKT